MLLHFRSKSATFAVTGDELNFEEEFKFHVCLFVFHERLHKGLNECP